MNINLSGTSKSKKGGKSLGFGLNKRKKNTTNVLDAGDDDDSDEEDGSSNAPENNDSQSKRSRRDAVNREIAAEQEALRKRAMKAMEGKTSSRGENDVYDYDGAYDSFKKPVEDARKAREEAAAAVPPHERKSRYIQDLLKQSEKRAIEREAIYERKVAKEQEEEDQQADFRGKEKFVTKAYQRKLEERQRLVAEDKKQQARDEKADVTKQTGGAAFANFYGNLNRNVAMGGGAPGDGDNDKKIAKGKQQAEGTEQTEASGGVSLGFMEGFEPAGSNDADTKDGPDHNDSAATGETENAPKKVDPAAMRKARAQKLEILRLRYFQRNDIPVDA